MDLGNTKAAVVGDPAPDFQLKTQDGSDWRLADHLGNVVALLFYPKDETLVCTRQMCSLRDHWADYLATKALIVGVSPGSAEEHDEFSRHHKLPITLLADSNKSVTEMYGFHWLFPTFFTRSIIIIDARGIIRTRRVMLRAFRPSDRSVIGSIYAARTDHLNEKLENLRKRGGRVDNDK